MKFYKFYGPQLVRYIVAQKDDSTGTVVRHWAFHLEKDHCKLTEARGPFRHDLEDQLGSPVAFADLPGEVKSLFIDNIKSKRHQDKLMGCLPVPVMSVPTRRKPKARPKKAPQKGRNRTRI